MGAWNELDTEISVENDFSDLDTILGIDDKYGIYYALKDEVRTIRNAMDTGSKRGVEELAKKNVSFQEKWIKFETYV